MRMIICIMACSLLGVWGCASDPDRTEDTQFTQQQREKLSEVVRSMRELCDSARPVVSGGAMDSAEAALKKGQAAYESQLTTYWKEPKHGWETDFRRTYLNWSARVIRPLEDELKYAVQKRLRSLGHEPNQFTARIHSSPIDALQGALGWTVTFHQPKESGKDNTSDKPKAPAVAVLWFSPDTKREARLSRLEGTDVKAAVRNHETGAMDFYDGANRKVGETVAVPSPRGWLWRPIAGTGPWWLVFESFKYLAGVREYAPLPLPEGFGLRLGLVQVDGRWGAVTEDAQFVVKATHVAATLADATPAVFAELKKLAESEAWAGDDINGQFMSLYRARALAILMGRTDQQLEADLLEYARQMLGKYGAATVLNMLDLLVGLDRAGNVLTALGWTPDKLTPEVRHLTALQARVLKAMQANDTAEVKRAVPEYFSALERRYLPGRVWLKSSPIHTQTTAARELQKNFGHLSAQWNSKVNGFEPPLLPGEGPKVLYVNYTDLAENPVAAFLSECLHEKIAVLRFLWRPVEEENRFPRNESGRYVWQPRLQEFIDFLDSVTVRGGNERSVLDYGLLCQAAIACGGGAVGSDHSGKSYNITMTVRIMFKHFAEEMKRLEQGGEIKRLASGRMSTGMSGPLAIARAIIDERGVLAIVDERGGVHTTADFRNAMLREIAAGKATINDCRVNCASLLDYQGRGDKDSRLLCESTELLNWLNPLFSEPREEADILRKASQGLAAIPGTEEADSPFRPIHMALLRSLKGESAAADLAAIRAAGGDDATLRFAELSVDLVRNRVAAGEARRAYIAKVKADDEARVKREKAEQERRSAEYRKQNEWRTAPMTTGGGVPSSGQSVQDAVAEMKQSMNAYFDRLGRISGGQNFRDWVQSGNSQRWLVVPR